MPDLQPMGNLQKMNRHFESLIPHTLLSMHLLKLTVKFILHPAFGASNQTPTGTKSAHIPSRQTKSRGGKHQIFSDSFQEIRIKDRAPFSSLRTCEMTDICSIPPSLPIGWEKQKIPKNEASRRQSRYLL